LGTGRTNPWFDPNEATLLVLNHRDALDAVPAAELVRALAWTGRDVVQTVASAGEGLPAAMDAMAHALTRAAERLLAT
jgi:hypothetical protein